MFRLLLDPLAGGEGGSGSESEPEQTTESTQQTTETQTTDGGEGGGEEGGQQTSATPTTPTPTSGTGAQPTASSVLEVARQRGVDLSRFGDESAAAQALVDAYLQAQQIAPLAQYGQRYLQHAPEIEAYLRQREDEARKRKEPEQPQPWFQAPEYDPTWLQQVETDEQGNLRPKPGVSPEVVTKLQRYAQFRRDFQEKFWSNPEQMLSPLIEQKAQEIADKIVEQKIGGYQQQQSAQQFIAANAKMLFAHDAAGNPVADPVTGQLVLSQDGVKFRKYLEEANEIGITDQYRQQQYALRLLNADKMTATVATSATNTKKKQEFLGQRTPNHAGSLAAAAAPSAPPQNSSLSLLDQLRQSFKEAGITDDMIAAE